MSPISIAALIQALMAVSEASLDLGQEADEQGRDLCQGEHANSANEPGGPDSDSHAASNCGNLGEDAIDATL